MLTETVECRKKILIFRTTVPKKPVLTILELGIGFGSAF